MKGAAAERELVRELDNLGFAVLRAPASGARTTLDRPDLVAGRRGLHLALEVKTTSNRSLYVKKQSIEQLMRFAGKFGATPYLAVKFKRRRCGWLLVDPTKLKETAKGFTVTYKKAVTSGKKLEALVARPLNTFE